MKFIHLLLCSVFTFFVLYGPQPILPLLASDHSLSEAEAGLLMTVTMLPLAIAPLAYGYILLNADPLKLLKWAFLALAISCFLFPLATSFESLLFIRFIQGLILPAALTAMTSYIGQHYRFSYLSKAVSAYILSTIAGGFLGRVVSASVSEYTHWQSFFFALAIILGLLALSLQSAKTRLYVKHKTQSVPLRDNLSLVFKGGTFNVYLAVFGMFFCFTALLNYLPFILKNDYQFTSSKNIGLVYSGYLLGASFSLLSSKLQAVFSGKINLLVFTFTVYGLSTITLMSNSFTVFFVAFTLFCAAMFIIHASASALLNQISSAPSSLTNSFYVSFYYCGGAVGSFAPGIIYQSYGKQAFILTLLIMCVLSALLIVNFRRLQVKQSNTVVGKLK